MKKQKTKNEIRTHFIGLNKVGDHYELSTYNRDLKEFITISSQFNDGVKALGKLNELMDKYDFENIEFIDSLLNIFRETIFIAEYGEETRKHHLKSFNKDFAYTIGEKCVNCCGTQISSTDFMRLKMFLPKDHLMKLGD